MIVYTMEGGSSAGFHHHMKFGQCPKKATLDGQHGDGPHNYSQGTAEGKVGHAFAELYYSGHVFDPEDVLFDPPPPAWIRTEMSRVWREYRVKFPPDEFGRVISVEEGLGGPLVEAAVGVAPYTMKADLVIHLENEEQCARLVSLRPELTGIQPGRYGVDHKFLKRKPSNLGLKYPNSLQFVGYQLGWNAVHPETPVDGWIVNIVVKTKEVQFYSLFVPPPTELQVKALRVNLKFWKFIKEHFPNQTNAQEDYCFGFVEPCYWWKTGVCDRGQGDDLVQLSRRIT